MKHSILSQIIRKTRRVVIKVGSSVLIKNKGLSYATLLQLARAISFLEKKEIQTVVVSSGAIASGMHHLGFREKPHKLPELQACAAVGQPLLMKHYQKALDRVRLQAAQVLLTRADLEDVGRFSNAQHTFNELFRHRIVPIINENDTVAVEEIRVGDNDNLAALVTNVAQAHLLILLTDRDGFYTADPEHDPKATRLAVIDNIDEVAGLATDTKKTFSTGGMKTKLQAARKACEYGVPTLIADGRDPKVLQKIFSGKLAGTLFHLKKS